MELRFLIFLSLLFILTTLEFVWPRRTRDLSRKKRWPVNISITFLNTLLGRLLFGSIPLALATQAFENKQGIIGYFGIEGIPAIIISFLVLDMLIYFQHILFHATPVLWRLHKVHHSDPDLDVTSGFRFHPIEIILSLCLKMLGIAAIGAHPVGFLIFEIMLNAGSLFNHSNIGIKGSLDKIIRLFVVTPDMHRIHHSVVEGETNSNFSFSISIWDRIFGTYKASASESQENIKIGLEDFDDDTSTSLKEIILIPLRKTAQGYSFKKK
ncbi:MAG: sterol desaturase family protein [Oligoflexales bacterium]|nr:sterol desaturase family protein [Oligoflexales bacterium]